ncbi:MAG: tetratricopeptide repeat protein, partial [Anaerolineae bacterium]|nr:tetratricopeptide repeat protein [Anaerolineae bacterium]
EKLRQVADEAEQARDKLCDYYTAFLHARETELRGPRQQETLAEIAKEIENIRVSWRWAIIRNKAAAIERAMECLWYFYAMYGWFREGAEMFERAVVTFRKRSPSPNEAPADQLQADLLAKLGWFYLRQGQYERAQTVLEQSLTISTTLNNNEKRAAPLHFLGLLAGQGGDLFQAVEKLQSSLNLYRDAGNRWETTWVLSHLAYHLSQFDPASRAEAIAMLQESLSIYKAVGNQQGMAIALNSLGYIFSQQGDYPTARKLLEESLAIRRAIGFPRGIAVTLNNLGLVTMALDDLDASQKYYEESLEIAVDVDALPQALAALAGIAGILARAGQPSRAGEILSVVLNHPASNEETRQRAKKILNNLVTNATAPPIEASTKTFEKIVADILQRTVSEHAN